MAEYKGAKSEGDRARQIQKERDKQLQELQARKDQIRKEKEVKDMGTKFSQTTDRVEEEFKMQTVGLKTREEYAATRVELEKEKRVMDAMAEAEREKESAGLAAAEKEAADGGGTKRSRKSRAAHQKLSFNFGFDDDEDSDESDDEDDSDDDESDDESDGSGGGDKKTAATGVGRPAPAAKKFKMSKDPHVDTSFLPDRDREAKEEALRRQLAENWLQEQDKVKDELLEVTYSYWDGSGHRAVVRVRKGDTMAKFLQAVQKDWRELRTVSVENLMYIKEDLIIPHNYSFYDLIVTKARGKSGPLFQFDARDEIRQVSDATVEKMDSHPGKVCERRWYESNKHIFPANRWEVYDPAKKYGEYRIK